MKGGNDRASCSRLLEKDRREPINKSMNPAETVSFEENERWN